MNRGIDVDEEKGQKTENHRDDPRRGNPRIQSEVSNPFDYSSDSFHLVISR